MINEGETSKGVEFNIKHIQKKGELLENFQNAPPLEEKGNTASQGIHKKGINPADKPYKL